MPLTTEPRHLLRQQLPQFCLFHAAAFFLKVFLHSAVFLKLVYHFSSNLATVIARPWPLWELGLKSGCWAGLFLMALLPSAAELLFCP